MTDDEIRAKLKQDISDIRQWLESLENKDFAMSIIRRADIEHRISLAEDSMSIAQACYHMEILGCMCRDYQNLLDRTALVLKGKIT